MLNRLRSNSPAWLQSVLGPPPLRLETERLVLREFSLSDWMAVCAYRNDPDVLRYLERTEPYSDVEIQDLVFSAAVLQPRAPRRATWDFALVYRGNRELIGECGLWLTEDLEEALLGYLLRRDCWGRGYTTEAAAAVVAFGFEELKLARVTAGCHPENRASWRVMEKLGMRSLGLMAGFPGSPAGVDALVMSISAEEWRTGRGACPSASLTPEAIARIRPRPR